MASVDSREPERTRGGSPLLGPSTRPSILLVEDDPDNLELLEALLSTRYAVRRATSGEQAAELAQGHTPDLILADLCLPRMNGLEMLDVLRSDPRTQAVPVIFLSGHRDEQRVVRALEHGAADFIAKPPAFRELFARVDRTLREAHHRVTLEELATTDALTGLYNFRALASRVDEEMGRAVRYGYAISCVMLDLDRLKSLNDEHGHGTGNRALAAVGELLRGDLRGADFAARYGGDEFLVLLPHQAPAEAKVFADRFRSALRELVLESESGEPISGLTVSAGVAGHLPGGPALETGGALLRAADLALYEAKRSGRDRVVMHEHALAPEPSRGHPPGTGFPAGGRPSR